jgi:hypothetical protein
MKALQNSDCHPDNHGFAKPSIYRITSIVIFTHLFMGNFPIQNNPHPIYNSGKTLNWKN